MSTLTHTHVTLSPSFPVERSLNFNVHIGEDVTFSSTVLASEIRFPGRVSFTLSKGRLTPDLWCAWIRATSKVDRVRDGRVIALLNENGDLFIALHLRPNGQLLFMTPEAWVVHCALVGAFATMFERSVTLKGAEPVPLVISEHIRFIFDLK
jgi:hypothetical protein